MKMKKIVAVILALCLVLSLNTVAFAGYNDVGDGHWAKGAIDRWTEYGVFVGDQNGNFNPAGYLTRAEAAAVMARLFRLTEKGDISGFTDVQADDWFAECFALCVAAGIVKGTSDTTLDPTKTIPREQFFTMFARGLGLTEARYANVAISDDADIADWAKGFVYALVNGGYLKGTSSSGTVVAPKEFINRASVAALLDQTISVYATAGDETRAYEGRGIALIVAGNVTLTDAPAGTIVVTRNAPGAKVNGVDIPATTVYIVPAAPQEGSQGGSQGGTGGVPVVPTKTHREIIDEAVASYVSAYDYPYAKLTKDGYTVNVEILDPSVTIGTVYSDIGESLLKALQNQVNPSIVNVKATMDESSGQLKIDGDTTVLGIHDLVYDVTGFAGNNTIGELDGKTIRVAFVDSDCPSFVYAFVFEVAE